MCNVIRRDVTNVVNIPSNINIFDINFPGISCVSGDAGLESGDFPEFGPEPDPSLVFVGVVGGSLVSSSVVSSKLFNFPIAGLLLL